MSFLALLDTSVKMEAYYTSDRKPRSWRGGSHNIVRKRPRRTSPLSDSGRKPVPAAARQPTTSRQITEKEQRIKQSYHERRRKKQQFQSKVDAAARRFSDCVLEIRRQPDESYRMGKPVTLIISESPRLARDGLKWCVRELFDRFLRIGEQFPNEIAMNPVRWAGKRGAKVIKEAVRGKRSSELRQQLLALLGQEADEAILRQPVTGHETSDAVQRTRGAQVISPAQRKHEEVFLEPGCH